MHVVANKATTLMPFQYITNNRTGYCTSIRASTVSTNMASVIANLFIIFCMSALLYCQA